MSRLALVLSVVLLLASCSDDAGSERPVVLAASSLRADFVAVADTLPDAGAPAFSFDSSAAHVRQLRSGARADVVATADRATMLELEADGLLASRPHAFATNELVLLVAADADPRGALASLADLAHADEPIALCVPSAPCGRLADDLVEHAGIRLPKELVTRQPNAASTLAAVTNGEAVAALVYRTDALAVSDGFRILELPVDAHVSTTYWIAVLDDAASPDAAEAFVTEVLGAENQRRLRALGFGAP